MKPYITKIFSTDFVGLKPHNKSIENKSAKLLQLFLRFKSINFFLKKYYRWVLDWWDNDRKCNS